MNGVSTRPRPWRSQPLGVQGLGDLTKTDPDGDHAEDPPDRRRLVLTDLAHDMRAAAAISKDWDVAVAEHDAADDVPALRLDLQGIARPLAGLGPLQLRCEVRDGHDELIDRAVESNLVP
jgi:hypothetical protein